MENIIRREIKSNASVTPDVMDIKGDRKTKCADKVGRMMLIQSNLGVEAIKRKNEGHHGAKRKTSISSRQSLDRP